MQNHRYLRAESLAKQVWEMVRNDDTPDVKKFLDIVPHVIESPPQPNPVKHTKEDVSKPVSAKNLNNWLDGDSLNFYVKITCLSSGFEFCKTYICNDINPEWNQEFYIPIYDIDKKFKIRVYNNNAFFNHDDEKVKSLHNDIWGTVLTTDQEVKITSIYQCDEEIEITVPEIQNNGEQSKMVKNEEKPTIIVRKQKKKEKRLILNVKRKAIPIVTKTKKVELTDIIYKLIAIKYYININKNLTQNEKACSWLHIQVKNEKLEKELLEFCEKLLLREFSI
ncbi:hypothetical protein RhiirC2_704743 [Rhizophagus irregularis]|uniref:C2 domain-containing protein n=1 Tax=Rhizophagus irregularis TaxID=588596 RepID=A0A2N1P110_9GLOM|nr:hypothetical protein RhiirC2_704743 [Rhizophagus irregularis]